MIFLINTLAMKIQDNRKTVSYFYVFKLATVFM